LLGDAGFQEQLFIRQYSVLSAFALGLRAGYFQTKERAFQVLLTSL
jgi:hypothetical protein